MIRFECDYLEGAHPKILEAVARVSAEQNPGYGEDTHSEAARDLIRAACRAPLADVHFLVGGTQVNFIVIAAALRPHQGVVSAQTGHIAVHETGAVEATGHKVLTVPSDDGKITASQIRALCQAHWADSTHEHMVQPGMVYISHPTENGTVYTRRELRAIREACKAAGLFLYVDGARMGYGLAASDLTLADFAELTDAFTIGGTKVGLLMGEALVVTHPDLRKDFRYLMKQNGGMLAKGFLLGAQFEAAFTGGLYEEMGKKAVAQAMRIRKALEDKGIPLFYDSPTNQQYPVFEDGQLRKLQQKYVFAHWAKADEDHTAARICASWATTDEHVAELIEDIRGL